MLRQECKVFMLRRIDTQVFSLIVALSCCTEPRRRGPVPARSRLRDADEVGLSKLAHAIERFDRDRHLRHATRLAFRLGF